MLFVIVLHTPKEKLMDIRQTLSDYPNLLGVPEVAQILGIEPNTVYIWLRNRKLPGIKVGKSWRVLKEDIITYLEAHKTEPST